MISRTLFIYVFWDLVRFFFLASGVLSAIMSFGGLLKPLYEFGLNIAQVGQIMMYSGPAMTAYALPIAALFATTIVYGRLSADNELTACRAAGIPLGIFGMALPALVLGLLLALVSLALLCFVVPASTLKVERIIFSNLARLAADQIERSHQISQIRLTNSSQPLTVFAQTARVLPIDPARPNDQQLQLGNPVIVTYEPPERGKPLVPRNFYMAGQAIVSLQQDNEHDDVTMTATLYEGMKFPRTPGDNARDNSQVSIGRTSFGPVPLNSPVRENEKFMDIFRLRDLLANPERSRRISNILRDFIRRDQQQAYLDRLAAELNGPAGFVELSAAGESYKLIRGAAPAHVRKQRLILPGSTASPARIVQTGNRQGLIEAKAFGEITVDCWPDAPNKRMSLDIEVIGCELTVGGDLTERKNFPLGLTVPMPEEISAISNRGVGEYIASSLTEADMMRLRQNWLKQTNSLIGELHARMSFAVSCFILVMVGCALGMMFRSGNFLSAFAISAAPALISIALIVTGQHTCESVPSSVGENWHNPLKIGLTVIWSGNIAVLAIAAVLLTKLQRR